MNVMELKAIGEPERKMRPGKDFFDIKKDANVFFKSVINS